MKTSPKPSDPVWRKHACDQRASRATPPLELPRSLPKDQGRPTSLLPPPLRSGTDRGGVPRVGDRVNKTTVPPIDGATKEPARRLRPFGGLVEEAKARDVSRSVAFLLASQGLLETFAIGRRRYVYIDSLDTLGERLSELEAKK